MKTIFRTVVCFAAVALFLLSHGEHVWAKTAKIYVDAAAVQGGDGSKQSPFRRITDAVNSARAIWLADSKAKTKIEINIESGNYFGSYSNTDPGKEDLPIILDIPGLKFTGNTSMRSDSDAWPIEPSGSDIQSVLRAQPSLTDGQSLIIIASTSSVLTGQGVEVSKVTLDIGYSTLPATPVGSGIIVNQRQDFAVRNNYVKGGGVVGIDVRASRGQIEGNYVTGVGCGICVGAGNAVTPANVTVTGNRSVSNWEGGLILGGDITASGFDELSAVVEENDFSDSDANVRQGFGIRVIVAKHEPPDTATSGHITATIFDNRISHNNFGFSIDAGFPYRVNKGTPDPKLYTGKLDLSFGNNEVEGNHRSPALISFTRITSTLIPSQLSTGTTQYKYLQNSIYNITDPQGEFNGYWIDHPIFEPVDGRMLQNTLRINGILIPNGRYVPFP